VFDLVELVAQPVGDAAAHFSAVDCRVVDPPRT
jgi:hypothetical protein